jgi:hypothetical protein
MQPKYPIYIISKGRWESRLTSKALEKMNIPYHIVVEPQEFDEYAKVIDEKKILTLPFSELGQGSIPSRNWVWDHAIERKAKRHWILDDNIRCFYYWNKNKQYKVNCGNTFRAIEDWSDRYKNVVMSGMEYFMFAPRKTKVIPIRLNTRIYSCILLQNDIPHRWRGRYNEDTDLSLRILKDGYCTALFHAFLAHKMTTMTMTGGNTEALYEIADGRLKMTRSLKNQHPDVVSITKKWNRWHHHVDYRGFIKNKLIRDERVKVKKGIHNYGMRLASA